MPAAVDSIADTIVACSTPPGEGAIAVLRLSGPESRRIAATLAPARRPRASHELRPAKLFDRNGNLLDAAMVVEMHAPHSYTGEDLVELHLHGSRAVVAAVREACVQAGARLAQPGEFTLRAFLNGRMDLAQAEAVADLIGAASETQRSLAARQLDGGLSQVVGGLVEKLEAVLADWRATLDFPEHPSGDGVDERHWTALEEIDCRIQALMDSARIGLRRGQRVVLCGAPNAGKSTLLNAWAGQRRVLVDAVPGTTRDPVEVELTGQRGRWTVIDTAGIRAGAAGLEAEGIVLALEKVRGADLVLWLLGGDDPQWPPDEVVLRDSDARAGWAGASLRQRDVAGGTRGTARGAGSAGAIAFDPSGASGHGARASGRGAHASAAHVGVPETRIRASGAELGVSGPGGGFSGAGVGTSVRGVGGSRIGIDASGPEVGVSGPAVEPAGPGGGGLGLQGASVPVGARELLVVGGKSDLVEAGARQAVEAEARRRGLSFAGWVSGLGGEGVEALRQALSRRLQIDPAASEAVVVRQRHLDALGAAHEALARLQQARLQTVPDDLLCMDLEAATTALGHIVGRDVDSAVLERIFSQFCIGK